MDGSFGNRLRTQREQQQIPLAVIAERTKIKASLLEALERGDVSQWPTGIFRRSFVRSYAHAIGLDSDTVLREFMELYPEQVEEDVTAALAAARESRRPSTRLGYLISSAFGALPVRVPGAKPRPSAPVPVPAGDARTPDAPRDFRSLEDAAAIQASAAERVPEAVMSIDDGTGELGLDADGFEAHQSPPPPHEAWAAAEADDAEGGDDALAAPLVGRAGREPDLTAIADMCARLARVLQPRDVTPVLEDAARLLNAVGLIVWMWDSSSRTLTHVLSHGYSSDILARLPRVRCETDNAIADAFRSSETRVVKGSGASTGAVVVPMVTAGGCAGVLALELQGRGEERECVRAVATILAAQLTALFGFQALAEAVSA